MCELLLKAEGQRCTAAPGVCQLCLACRHSGRRPLVRAISVRDLRAVRTPLPGVALVGNRVTSRRAFFAAPKRRRRVDEPLLPVRRRSTRWAFKLTRAGSCCLATPGSPEGGHGRCTSDGGEDLELVTAR
ncbi:hypothetical protein MRX96_012368 [Rhipicephalus microplus]